MFERAGASEFGGAEITAPQIIYGEKKKIQQPNRAVICAVVCFSSPRRLGGKGVDQGGKDRSTS